MFSEGSTPLGRKAKMMPDESAGTERSRRIQAAPAKPKRTFSVMLAQGFDSAPREMKVIPRVLDWSNDHGFLNLLIEDTPGHCCWEIIPLAHWGRVVIEETQEVAV